jgi:Raf kinase inhibitor-like YbhB/YbcL family protein
MSKLGPQLAALLTITALAGCGGGGNKIASLPAAPAKIKVTSGAFDTGGTIPATYTCEGANTSPPLAWTAVPKQARSLALIVADPDAPGGTFVHWTLFDLEPRLSKLAQGAVPSGAREGKNGFGKNGYKGPCPPAGKPHTYEFTLYALRAKPSLEQGASPQQVRDEVAKLALGRGTLRGSFGR